jgi:hypothetical protein
MGCWNGTCAVSNLHVKYGQDVVVFLLAQNQQERTFCYGNALYDVCPVPFYGIYNDYGAVEKCHGFGMNIVVEALRSQLYEFGQGPNQYHDCEVRKDKFDIDLLFEADHEDRLGVEYHRNYSSDAYSYRELQEKAKEVGGLTDSQRFELDRLAAKIKQEDTFRRVTHIVIHGDVFRGIINDWYIEDYVGDGKGTTGYGKNYNHIYFKDMLASIPEYITRMKAKHEELRGLQSEVGTKDPMLFNRLYRSLRSDAFEWNDPCLAGRWLQYFRSDSASTWALVDVTEQISDYVEAEDWENLEAFVKEVLTAAWVNSFMAHTRKVWTQQTGMGSQNQEPLGYQVLANTVLNILKAEKAEYGDEDEELDEDADTEAPAEDSSFLPMGEAK